MISLSSLAVHSISDEVRRTTKS